MPLRTPKISETVSYRYGAGKTTDAVVLAKQQAAPAAPTTTTAITGGTLAAATYSYRVTAVIDGIETPASAVKTQVVTDVGNASTVTVNWSAAAGTAPFSRATAFKVYGRTGTQLLIATVNMPTTQYVDTGAVTPAGAAPTATGTVRLKLIHLKTVVNVAKATLMKQVNRYYAR